MSDFRFTWKNLESEYESLLAAGYTVMTCENYVHQKGNLPKKTVVNRIDIDLSVKKVSRLLDIYNRLQIKGTFFVRLHAPEYNPFSFENYKILKRLLDEGHELGYHSEVIDQSKIWNEDPETCLRRDLKVLGSMFDYEVKSAASHGGMTGFNNLDFWKERKPAEFGLLYEGYDHEPQYNLFQESFYISDSEWTQWKCYNRGEKVDGDQRSPKEHIVDGHKLVHLLIHSDTYFDHHFYE
ncbi:polysaccharide deacetylase family protein [Roseivirga sp. E12]|uniref:polysaccharide deacetylase family protein n=1 Tax=Roseivirga sp. E12 TaxID=2819237 RepID=UPI001ABCC8DC|nr:polysaccharide deacetylase family protein [Roseivirga sp. E12]MBO3699756.1 hypothetical protein [Roseivirga sp. E12]